MAGRVSYAAALIGPIDAKVFATGALYGLSSSAVMFRGGLTHSCVSLPSTGTAVLISATCRKVLFHWLF